MAYYRCIGGSGGGGGGGVAEVYSSYTLIGSDGGSYISSNLDRALDINRTYYGRIYDGSNVFDVVIGTYSGSTIVVQFYNDGNFELTMTSTTVGLTNYSGNWRNIYIDIIGVDYSQV